LKFGLFTDSSGLDYQKAMPYCTAVLSEFIHNQILFVQGFCLDTIIPKRVATAEGAGGRQPFTGYPQSFRNEKSVNYVYRQQLSALT
jgi:hypothetical protein